MTSWDDLRFLSHDDEISKHSNRLPHWQQDGQTFFVTFRTADSLPRELIEQWVAEREAWLRLHESQAVGLRSREAKPPLHALTEEEALEYDRLFSDRIEAWLDDFHGACVLRRPELAKLVGEALRILMVSAAHNMRGW